MTLKRSKAYLFAFLSVFLLSSSLAFAQSQDDVGAQANNPLANLTAFNIQDYYIGDLTEIDKR